MVKINNQSNPWMDSFKNDSGIDWALSDNLRLFLGDVEINGTYYSIPNPVALWHFDEGYGKIAYDTTINNNDGILKNGTSWTTGKFRKALSFDGVNDYVDCGSNTSLDSIMDDYTICIWIYPKGFGEYNWGRVFSKSSGYDGINVYLENGTGQESFKIAHEGANDTRARSNWNIIKLNRWQFICVVHENSTNMGTLYHNGIDVTKEGNIGDIINHSSANAYIGNRFNHNRAFNGSIDEIAIYNRALSAKELRDLYQNSSYTYEIHGNLTSKTIKLPKNMYWDTLIVNKTEPENTYLNITILNADSNEPISFYEDFTGNKIDLSFIDPHIYSSIKLQAKFTSNGTNSSILHDWSVNWTENTAPKIQDVSSINTINRTNTVTIKINLVDKENLESNLNLKVQYKSPIDSTWQNEYLEAPYFKNDHWECTFTPPSYANLGSYSFRFTCEDLYQFTGIYPQPFYIDVINNDPFFLDVYSMKSKINRTERVNVFIKPIDIEIPSNELTINLKYKSLIDNLWQTDFISKIHYNNTHWEAQFTTIINATLGLYNIKISCSDGISEVTEHIFIEVINNKPTQPKVQITPNYPKTTDELNVLVSDVYDIETPVNQIEYRYKWFKNEIPMPEFNNLAKIPASYTKKNETWTCEVYPFDGEDLGLTGKDEATIENSPPVLVEPFKRFEIFEDTPMILEQKLMDMFYDPDIDTLAFNATGQNYIEVKINQVTGTILFTPSENWYGTEYITFYANDSFSIAAEETVKIVVKPTNDLPRIIMIGDIYTGKGYPELEFTVNQDEWLNLTIIVEDFDGEVERDQIEYFMNKTYNNLRLNDNKLIFHPKNDDVGWHFINIYITDNNETPLQYVSQQLKIYVKNVNDPPNVKIIEPIHGSEFFDTDKVSFKCIAEDIDLLIWNSDENLSFKWIATKTNSSELGTISELYNITLLPGFYNITIEVEDATGEIAQDFVHIMVKEIPKVKSRHEQSTKPNYLCFIVLLFVIIIIIGTLFFILKKRRRTIYETETIYQPKIPSTPLKSTLSQELLTPAKISSVDVQMPTDLETTQTTNEVQSHLKYTVEEKGLIGPTFNPQQNMGFSWRHTDNSENPSKIYL